jgi:hypothetical protein
VSRSYQFIQTISRSGSRAPGEPASDRFARLCVRDKLEQPRALTDRLRGDEISLFAASAGSRLGSGLKYAHHFFARI